jgi:glycosyltransferase involved in cell wall biosynthesis
VKCDIIIPTYNSAAVILPTLQALFAEPIPISWQPRIIIVDDGSSDNTIQLVRSIPIPSTWRSMLVIPTKHTGVATARNAATAASDADILLFLGADIVVRPHTLEQHLVFHDLYKQPHIAALGMVKWDPRALPTPLMEWMMHGGPQNDFDALLGSTTADPRHWFYGSHISIKRLYLGKEPFPTLYTRYGWEDLDCGRALAERGLQLYILHQALGLHNHNYSVAAVCRRQSEAGRMLVTYQRRYPQILLLPPQRLFKKVIWKVVHRSNLAYLLQKLLSNTAGFFSTPYLFSCLATAYLRRGIYKGLHEA